MRIGRRTLLRAGLGITISLVAGYFLLRSVDLAKTAQVLLRASPAWIGIMVVTVLLDIGARGARWRALLAPIASLPYRRVLGYTYLGYLANNVLPARLGELVRSHALGEGEGISRTTVLGTVVVERIVDTAIVVGVAAVAVLLVGSGGIMAGAVVLGFAFVGVLVVGLVLGVVAHRLPGAERVAGVIARRPRLLELGNRLRDGLAVAGRPPTLATAIAFSAIAWSASTVTFVAAGWAVGIELSLAQGALLTSGVALATIIPSGPGYLGTFELTAVGIAGGFGIGRDEGFAIAILVHAMILAVTSIGGTVAALRLGIGAGRLIEDAEVSETVA